MADKKYIITGVSHGWKPEVTALCLDAKKAEEKGKLWEELRELEQEIDKLTERIARLCKDGLDRMPEDELEAVSKLIEKRAVFEGQRKTVWEEYTQITSRDAKDSLRLKRNAKKARVGQVYDFEKFSEQFMS